MLVDIIACILNGLGHRLTLPLALQSWSLMYTAFFRRNSMPLFDPRRDGWWLQRYYKTRFPVLYPLAPPTRSRRLRRLVPKPVKRMVRRTSALRLHATSAAHVR